MQIKYQKGYKKQAGITLMEIIGGLAIMGAVVVGALSLFNAGDSSQKSTQLLTDIVSIRSAVKQSWGGQGGYGTASMNNTLAISKKLPTDLKVDTSTTPYTITHSVNNGTIAVAGNTSTFTITVTALPEDICSDVVSRNSGSGWTSITIGGSAIALPTTPTAATTACGSSSSNTVVFTAG